LVLFLESTKMLTNQEKSTILIFFVSFFLSFFSFCEDIHLKKVTQDFVSYLKVNLLAPSNLKLPSTV